MWLLLQLVFQLAAAAAAAQHLRDELLLESFVAYFNCGRLVRVTGKHWGYFQCTKFSDNYEIIIEFFKKHPIRGVKGRDFADWIRVAEIIKNGRHLTPEGSKKILQIKSGMNTGRSTPPSEGWIRPCGPDLSIYKFQMLQTISNLVVYL
jgi:hypothetical protein